MEFSHSLVLYQKSHSFAALTHSISDTSPIHVKIPYAGAFHEVISIYFMLENLYLNHVVPECQITNKVNKERDKRKHQSQEKILKQIDVYGSLLEGKRHQSLARQN